MNTALETLHRRLAENPDLSSESRAELLGLVEELEAEAATWAELPEADQIRATLEEAAAPGDSAPSFQDRLLELEAAHPQVSALIGRLANMLSRIGI